MASNINPYNINGQFPIAGQDNSSQGFRTNFTNIQNNFAFAQSEISDLQSKVILTSALTGQQVNNDMSGTVLRRPQLAAWTQTSIDLGTFSNTTVTLDFNQANFQKITTAGPITLNFANWPAALGSNAIGYGVMRVWIYVSNQTDTVTLPASVDIKVNDIAGYEPNTNMISFDAPGDYVFDISSIDGGNNYLIFDVTRNRATFRDPTFYLNNVDTLNPTLFIGYNESSLPISQQFELGQDVISINGSMNSVSVGNLTLANISYSQLDTGALAGYSVTSARGNLSASVYQPVHSNDFLGYVNGIAFTGNGTSNTFQQISSINFFATGSNVQYGLGGNIAFFTADDGGRGPNQVIQALGLENDQSAKAYGNLTVAGNLVTQGARIESGYQYASGTTTPNVSAGFSLSISSTVNRLILDPTSTFSGGNIILPIGNVDARVVTISSTQTISNLAINAPSGQSVKPAGNITLNSGTGATYFFHAVESAWYKVG